MRKQAEHRIRAAASIARTRSALLAALVMNAPSLAAAVAAGWLALESDQPALAAMAWILFALAFVWAAMVTLESWRVLRRFARRGGR